MAITDNTAQLLSQHCYMIGQGWQQFGDLLVGVAGGDLTKLPTVTAPGGARGVQTTPRVRNRNRSRTGGARGLGNQARITQPTR